MTDRAIDRNDNVDMLDALAYEMLLNKLSRMRGRPTAGDELVFA